MKKVKIKALPSSGTQVNYSLLRKSSYRDVEEQIAPDIKNTVGPDKEGKKVVEAEKGEVILGESEGNLFLSKIGGKPHSKGGTVLNTDTASPGSFIFSNTKDMEIKDTEILKNFSFKGKKATPAELAWNFKLNEYIDRLKDKEQDAITQRSDQAMIEKNLEKLAELAIVQEGNKGFPNGVPSFVQSVLPDVAAAITGQLQQQQQMQQMQGQQEVPMAKYGGDLPKMAEGGDPPKKGEKFYINNIPVTVKYVYKGTMGKEWVKFDGHIFVNNPKGNYYFPNDNMKTTVAKISEITLDDYNVLKNKGRTVIGYDDDIQFQPGSIDKINPLFNLSLLKSVVTGDLGNRNELVYSQKILNKEEYQKQKNPYEKNPYYQKGYSFMDGNKEYKVEDVVMNPNGTHTIMTKLINDPDKDIISLIKKGYNSTLPYSNLKMFDSEEYNKIINSETMPGASEETQPEENESNEVTPTKGAGEDKSTTVNNTKSIPTTEKTNSQSKKLKAGQIYNINQIEYKYGGSIQIAQDGTEVKAASTTKKAPKEGEVFAGKIGNDMALFKLEDGKAKVLFPVYKGNLTTPTGKADSFALSFDQFKNYVNNIKARKPDAFKNITKESEFQTLLYNDILERDPDKIINMWNTYGQTIKGGKEGEELEKQLEGLGVKIEKSGKAYKFDFTAIDTPEKKKAVAEALLPSYADGMIGVRTLNIIPKEDVAQVITTTPDVTPVKLEDNNQGVNTEYQGAATRKLKSDVKDETYGFLPDWMNYLGAATHPLNKYPPQLQQDDYKVPGYVLQDPSRAIAANQEQQARYQSMVSAGTDPQVAAAAILGSSGEASQNVANTIAQTQAGNVGIVNQAMSNAAQIENQAIGVNRGLLDKYITENANYMASVDAEKAAKKLGMTRTFNQLTDNEYKKRYLQEMFPDVSLDAMTGMLQVNPSGRNILGPDTYVNPMQEGKGTIDMDSYFKTYHSANNYAKEYAKQMGLSEEDAKSFVDKSTQNYMANFIRQANKQQS